MRDQTRRKFALAILFFALVAMGGCPKQTLANLTATLGNAVAVLAQVQGNTALAQQLREHTNTAVAIIQNWKEGQSAADAIRALNRIIDDLKLFPAVDRFKPLITFTLGTIANIIDLLNRGGTGGEKPHTDVRITKPPENATEFKHDWDAIRAGSPNMEQAPIL